VGVVVRKDSKYFWLMLERAGLPQIRESSRVLAKGVPPRVLKENRALAESIYAARMGDLARQRHGLAVEREQVTFSTYAAWYAAHVTPTKRTAAREASAIRTLTRFFGRYPLHLIDQALAREWVTARREQVKPGTVNRELDVLKSMLSAATPKYVPTNPLHGMHRLRARAAAPRILSYDDERQLLRVMAPPDQALLIGALDTLIRLADLVGLQWSQDHGTHLEIPDPKTEPYRVPVSTRLRRALDGLERSGAYVFHHLAVRTAKPRANNATYRFRAACVAAGVPYGRPDGMTWHGLRHTGATRAIDAGASLRDLMALGGWRDLKSVLRYTRPTKVDRTLVDAMSRKPHNRSAHAIRTSGRKHAKT
jgi:integrase